MTSANKSLHRNAASAIANLVGGVNEFMLINIEHLIIDWFGALLKYQAN
jgi:hypothetical protein